MMPGENQFEKRMKKLKSSYHEMPSFSSTEKITEEIIEKETIKSAQKNYQKKKWPMIGSLAAAVCVGIILVMSTMFSSNEQYANEGLEMAEEKAAPKTSDTEESSIQTEVPHLKENQYDIAAVERQQIILDTIEIEGELEQKTFQLYSSGPLEFSTYYPDDMLVESESSKAGDQVTFFANFNGIKHEEAFIRFEVLADKQEQSIEQVINRIENKYQNDEFTTTAESYEFALSMVEYRFKKEQANQKVVKGWLSLFKHHDRLYVITVQSPLEMGEGFEERIDYILNNIVWQK